MLVALEQGLIYLIAWQPEANKTTSVSGFDQSFLCILYK